MAVVEVLRSIVNKGSRLVMAIMAVVGMLAGWGANSLLTTDPAVVGEETRVALYEIEEEFSGPCELHVSHPYRIVDRQFVRSLDGWLYELEQLDEYSDGGGNFWIPELAIMMVAEVFEEFSLVPYDTQEPR